MLWATNAPEPPMSSNDYERIEQAIRFLEQRYHQQPSLEEIAEHLDLSQSHFQLSRAVLDGATRAVW
jgi:AraC-like DNA-binding protein